MRLYQENRRPNFQPSPLEVRAQHQAQLVVTVRWQAQMEARDAAIHQDMLDRAKSGLRTKCSTAARKARHCVTAVQGTRVHAGQQPLRGTMPG